MIVATLVLGMATLLTGAPAVPAAQKAPQPIRISGIVMQTKLVHTNPVKYPEAARKKNIQGTVALDILIGPDGSVESVKVTDGPKELTKAATDSVKGWKYQPVLLNGKAIEVETTVNVGFKLTKPPAKPAKDSTQN